MYSVDKSGYKQVLLDFHRQIRDSKKILEAGDIKIDSSKIANVAYFGMGGSGIVGDLLNDVLYDELKVPMSVTRSYLAPGYCSEGTLVIASSYSGNTEETLSALEQAHKSGAQIVAITSGGRMADLAKENGWSIITVPEGFMPRQALGVMFFPLYHLLGGLGLLSEYKEDLDSFIKFIADLSSKNNYPSVDSHVLSMDLARTVQNKIPVIYSTAPYLRTVSRRWQNQIHENAKSLAFANVIPEMNHNEIVGWELDEKLLKDLIVIFLENENPLPRIRPRIELSKKLIKKRGVKVIDIYSKGECILERVFSLVVLGDWMSYYLALNYKKDPATIRNIDFLKQEMEKIK